MAGPLQALPTTMLIPLQLPLSNIPERGGRTKFRRWFSRDEALEELRRALARVEWLSPRKMIDVSVYECQLLISTFAWIHLLLLILYNNVLQDIIELGRETRLHNLEVPRDDYNSKYWSEVRSLQSKLLLAEIKALYRKDLLV